MKTKGFLLADALLGLALMALVVMVALQSLQNAKGWTDRARSRKNVTDEAERLWLEIQTHQLFGGRDAGWTLSPDLSLGGMRMAKLTASSGEEFYVAVSQ